MLADGESVFREGGTPKYQLILSCKVVGNVLLSCTIFVWSIWAENIYKETDLFKSEQQC